MFSEKPVADSERGSLLYRPRTGRTAMDAEGLQAVTDRNRVKAPKPDVILASRTTARKTQPLPATPAGYDPGPVCICANAACCDARS